MIRYQQPWNFQEYFCLYYSYQLTSRQALIWRWACIELASRIYGYIAAGGLCGYAFQPAVCKHYKYKVEVDNIQIGAPTLV